tara:strand:+ start:204 stop:752 length:549 start_codon:yes stop_codon:yes gene_type:complete
MADLFKDFDVSKFKNKKPPGNKSLGTYKEIKELSNIKSDRKFVEDKDDVFVAFKSVAEKNKIDYPTKLVKSLIDGSSDVILELKKFYKRSRPRVVSEQLGVKLNDIELKTMKTPSYPSGHSAQGYLVGKVLSDKYPEASKDFMKEAKDISYSRNVAKAHYKSDSKFGDQLGVAMYEYVKDKI